MIGGHRVILRETDQSHSSKEGTHAMTTAHDIDLPTVLGRTTHTTTHPDVLRELLATFIHTLMGGAPNGPTPATATATPPIRHPYRHIGSCNPEAAPRFLFSGLAVGAPQARRAGVDHGSRHLLSAGCLDAADGQARRHPGHHVVVQVA